MPIGAVITYDRDPQVQVEVISNKRVLYEGEEHTLSALAQKLMDVPAAQGPAFFSYEGVNLVELRRRHDEQVEEDA